jgi:hypothetical protein
MSALRILMAAVLLMGTLASQPDPIPGWQLAGSNRFSYKIGLDHRTFHSGAASAVINCVNRCEGFGTLMQRVPAADYLAKRLRFSAWVSTNGRGGRPRIWMRVDGPGNQLQAFDNMDNRAKRGPFEWQQQTIVLDVPQSAELISFGLILDGPATAWIDDTALEIVDVTTKLTGSQFVTVKRKGPKEKRDGGEKASGGEAEDGGSILAGIASAQGADSLRSRGVAFGILNAGFEDGAERWKEH